MHSKKRISSFLLAIVMVLGTFNPVLAAGLGHFSRQANKQVIIEGKNEGRKLVFSLLDGDVSSRLRDTGLEISNLNTSAQRIATDEADPNREPGLEENRIKVKITLKGLNGKDFPINTIFPEGAKVTFNLYNDETFEETVIEKEFNANGQEIDFGIYEQEQIQNISIGLSEDLKIAGKIIESAGSGKGGAQGNTTFTIEIYQYVNTDVVVKTVDKNGKLLEKNPRTDKTNGKIQVKIGKQIREIDIPAFKEQTKPTETFTSRDVNTRNISNFQSIPTFELTGLENGVLVDKDANKVYKATIGTPDPNGIEPTEIVFTELGLLVLEGGYKPSFNYVQVLFYADDYKHEGNAARGSLKGGKKFFVYRGVGLGENSKLQPPTVEPIQDWKFTGWEPKVQKVYFVKDTVNHIAQYKYIGKDIVPQNPGNDKPNIPEDFVLLEFLTGEKGTIAETETTKYWVKPNAGKILTEIKKPEVTANEGFKFTGWDREDKTAIGLGGLKVIAKYKAKVVTENPNDSAYVSVSFKTTKGTIEGTKAYWVLKDEEVNLTAPTVNMGEISDYTFKAWDSEVKTTYSADIVYEATFNYTGKDIVPQLGEDKPEVPANFIKVVFKAGDYGKFEKIDGADQNTIFWVNPEKEVTLTAPTVATNKITVVHQGWDKNLKQKFTTNTEITAVYKGQVQPIEKVESEDELVAFGGTYDLTDNIKNLPKGAKVEDVTPEGTIDSKKSGEYTGKVKVTFENGSTRIVDIKVIVGKSQAETNDPRGQNITIKKGETPKAEDAITNKGKLPEGTKYGWEETPDTLTDGTKEAVVVVTYPDGSTDEVHLKVLIRIDGSIIVPIEKVESEDELVAFGGTYDLTDNIKNLPKGAKVEDVTPEGTIDSKKSGEYTGKVKITFENGSTRIVDIKVIVGKSQAETNNLEVKAVKIWKDGPKADHTAVKLNLYRAVESGDKVLVEGVDPEITPTTETADAFTYIWKNLPDHDENGKEFTYTLEEDGLETNEETNEKTVTINGNTYTVKQEENNITNTYKAPKIDVEATKVWLGDLEEGEVRPTIWFKLYRQVEGKEAEGLGELKELKAGTEKVTWEAEDRNDKDGKEFTYFVKEVNAEGEDFIPEGYSKIEEGLKVTNTRDPKDGKLTISKKLENTPERMIMMQASGVKAEPLKFKFTVTSPDGTSQEIELAAGESKDLDKLVYGKYTIKETESHGYTPFFSVGEKEESQSEEFVVEISSSEKVLVTVTNKNIINPNDLTVRATKVWVGEPQDDHTAVELKLLRTSDKEGSAEEDITDKYTVETREDKTSDTITYVWNNLPKHDSEGYAYTYKVAELGVEADKVYKVGDNEYKSEITDDAENTSKETVAFKITNTYQIPQIDLVGTKVWIDNKKAEERPEVKFELWRKNGTAGEGQKVVDEIAVVDNKADFGKQDKTDINGDAYEYYVKETTDLKDYVKSENGLTVTNTMKWGTIDPIATKDVTIEKVWVNGPKPDTELILKRQVGGKEAEEVGRFTATATELTKTFKSQPVTDKDGNIYKYFVLEPNVPENYEAEVEGLTITNTYIPSPIPEEYLVIFNGNGGEPVTQKKTAKDGQVIEGVEEPTRAGYTFVKWVKLGTNEEFDPAQPFSKDILNPGEKSLIFTAIWEKDEVPAEEYLVIFNGNGGDPATQKKTAKDGQVIEGVEEPTRAGYTFVKWVKLGTNEEFDPTQPFSKDFLDPGEKSLIFTAIWEMDKTPEPQPEPEPEPRPLYPHIPLDFIFGSGSTTEKTKPVEIERTHEAYVKGYPEGDFRPEGKMTRAEAVTIIVRLEGYKLGSDKPMFADTVEGGWYNKFINAAYEKGILEEKAGENFRPDEPITRGELARLISVVDKASDVVAPFADVKGHKYEKFINQAFGNERILGYPDGTFRPDADITRAEVTAMINRLYDRKADDLSFEKTENLYELKKFTDLTKNHWAYYDIMEAANTHKFVRRNSTNDKIVENWNKILVDIFQ